MRLILIVLVCSLSQLVYSQEIVRLQSGSSWTSSSFFEGYVCIERSTNTRIEINSQNVENEILLGPFIVKFKQSNRTNPLCHPFVFQKNSHYTFLFENVEEIVISSSEIEFTKSGQGYPKNYLFFFLTTVILFLLSAIIAGILYLVKRKLAFLFYAGYLICFSLFFISRYESFFLFDFIHSYSSHVGSSDFVFSILGIIFYNLFISHFLEFDLIIKKRFVKFNLFFFINLILCLLVFQFLDLEIGLVYFDMLRGLMLINVFYMIFCAWQKRSRFNQFIIYGSISVLIFSFLANILSYSKEYYGPGAWDHPLIYILIGFVFELILFTIAVTLKAQEDTTSHQQLQISIAQHRASDIVPKQSQIILSTLKSKMFVKIDNIIRCEAEGAYTRYIIKDKSDVLVSYTLREQELQLPTDQFFRVHQSFLININEVDQFVKADGGFAKMSDGKLIPVSRSKKDAFLRFMEKR